MSQLKGVLTALMLLLNTLVLFVPLVAVAVVKLIMPIPALRRRLSSVLSFIAESWAEVDKWIFAVMANIEWDIRGLSRLERRGSYLIISNHQSWVDIPALIQTFNRRIPFFKFFLKKELIWVPILGFVWWVLDYPFMKRYSKEHLQKHPELKGKDLEITRRSCEKFKTMPVSIVNYLEGTRFTPDKRDKQGSPYNCLLKPKAGGAAFTLAAMGEQLDAILDVTIVYPDSGTTSFWELLCGRVDRVVVDIESLPIEFWMLKGDYENDPAFRERFQQWVTELWQHKDDKIQRLKQGCTH